MQGQVHLDACLTGMGAIFNSEIYSIKLPDKFHTENIATLEMLNILVAVKIWAKSWEKKTLKIFCDDEAVVSVLSSGKTKDDSLAAISRNIAMACAESDISLSFHHIRGEKMLLQICYQDGKILKIKLKNWLLWPSIVYFKSLN